MKIIVKSLTNLEFTIEVEKTNRVEEIKRLIEGHIPTNQQTLIYQKHQMQDGNTLESYGITEGSDCYVVLRLSGGGCPADQLSECVGFLENDTEEISGPLGCGKLRKRYIRNTNSSKAYEQRHLSCYAYSACSAYINTVMRINDAKKAPTFAECFEIADYNKGNCGDPLVSLQLLEKKFNFGILADKVSSVSIKEILTISVIVSFTTSRSGWINVANGELLWFPGGGSAGWHATLVEGYDLDKDCMVCKNSWGDKRAHARFDLTESAMHDYYFVRVYFTTESIRGKTTKDFPLRIVKFKGNLDGKEIDCASMDETNAIYTSSYVCEKVDDKKEPMNYIGYDTEQWIKINLNREKEYPRYHYINKIECS